jgi:superfamily II DNA or RNA helicase
LTLNGQTPLEERSRVISKFQRSNLKYRVICISGEVGSVGIELDDKTGSFPRHMIVLPMTNAINFCQAIGRIQRTKTASHSTVSVIQPTRSLTYFKGQIQRKFQTLEQFMHTPDFMDLHQEHKSDCSFKPIEQYVPQLRLPTKAIARIQDFLCHCCS